MSKTDQLSDVTEAPVAEVTEDEAKAQQEQAEAEQRAKDEAEQAQALVPLERKIAEDVSRLDKAEAIVGSISTRIGIRLDLGAHKIAAYGRDWRVWAKGLVDRSQSRVYAMRNAGAVARVLGYSETAAPETLPGYLTLVPFYAVLRTAKDEKETKRREDQVRKAWAKLTEEGFPTQEEAEAKAKAMVARIRKAQETATEVSDEDVVQSGAEAQETDSPGETLHLDPAAVAATRTHLVPFFKQWKDELGVDETAAKIIMEGTLRLTGPDGPGRDLISAAIS